MALNFVRLGRTIAFRPADIEAYLNAPEVTRTGDQYRRSWQAERRGMCSRVSFAHCPRSQYFPNWTSCHTYTSVSRNTSLLRSFQLNALHNSPRIRNRI